MKNIKFIKFDYINFFFLITILVFLYLSKITFDCDSLYYFSNFHLQQDIPYRGIIYTFYLGILGVGTIFNTFSLYIFSQCIFSLLSFLLLRKILVFKPKYLNIIISTIIILSFQLITYMKVILPHNLNILFICLIFYYLYNHLYNLKKSNRNLFLLIFTLVISINIRAENIVILITLFSILCIVDLFSYKFNNLFINFLYLIYSYIFIIFIKILMIVGALIIFNIKPDFNKILSNSNGWFGKTMFIQFYQLKNDKSYNIYNILNNEKKISKIYVKPENGPNSIKLKELSIELFSDINNYIYLKDLLTSSSLVDGDNLNTNWWNKLFKSNDYNAEIITDNFFNEPNQILFDVLWRYIDRKIGKEDGDKLFLKVSIESFNKNPQILYAVINNFLWYFSFDLEKTLFQILSNQNFSIEFRSWTFDHHLRDSFNSGNCAKQLPNEMFSEYENSHYKFVGYDESGEMPKINKNLLNFEDKILYSLDYTKEIVFIIISIIFLILLLYCILLFKFNIFSFSVLICLISYNLLISMH